MIKLKDLLEDITIPVKIGDTILVGKFKNKKIVVKDIGTDKHGMPTINGRKATTFRIHKRVNIFDEESINEGVYDPGILKAFFLAGGPGSGKGYVASGLFGIPSKVNVSSYGLKVVNQDQELEMFLKKYGFGTDLDDMDDELYRQLVDPTYKDYSGTRTHAKALSKERLRLYSEGRLGVIVDGTGHKYSSIIKEKKMLEAKGYDTYMIFVYTSLEIAQRRNMERKRKLNPELVEKYWKEVQNNKISFQGLFGNTNFMMVDNSSDLDEKTAIKKFSMLIKKGIGKFIKKPVKNYLGKKWIEKQKMLKKR